MTSKKTLWINTCTFEAVAALSVLKSLITYRPFLLCLRATMATNRQLKMAVNTNGPLVAALAVLTTVEAVIVGAVVVGTVVTGGVEIET